MTINHRRLVFSMNMAALTFDINFCVQCRTKCETIRESQPCSLVPRYFVSSPLFFQFFADNFPFSCLIFKIPFTILFPPRCFTSNSLNVSTSNVILFTNVLIFLTKRQVELYIFCVRADPLTFFVDRFVHSSWLCRAAFVATSYGCERAIAEKGICSSG